MSDTQANKTAQKSKGLGRGLGSLLGAGGDGAFSKTMPPAEKSLEAFTTKANEQAPAAIKEGFVEKPAAAAAKPAVSPAAAPEKIIAGTPVPQSSPPAPKVEAKAEAPAPAPKVEANPPAPAPAPVKQEASPKAEPVEPKVPAHMRIWNIPIEKIFPNPNQPRQVFDKEPLEELALSIMEKGIIQPMLVRKSEDDTFEIIAGERRWRAAQIAGLKEVPAILKDTADQELLELALIENIQRGGENLNPIEESEAYDFLMKKYNLTQDKLASKVGKDRATVANMLRLLNLQPSVRQMVSRKELSMGQAKVLLGITDGRAQEKMAEKARNLNLSVRALEKMVAEAKNPSKAENGPEDLPSKMARALGEELQKLIGSKVVLDYEKGKGKIVINFYSDSELNQIADTLRDSWRH